MKSDTVTTIALALLAAAPEALDIIERLCAHERARRVEDVRPEVGHAEAAAERLRTGGLPPEHRATAKLLSEAGAKAEPRDNRATVDTSIDPATGQQRGYVVLSDYERSRGFVRPVRRSYVHATCGATTTMGSKLAETYAREPSFYTGTFCATCKGHFPVGEAGEFTWSEGGEKVGT